MLRPVADTADMEAGKAASRVHPSPVVRQQRLGRWLLVSLAVFMGFVVVQMSSARLLASPATQAVSLKPTKRFAYIFYITQNTYGCSALYLMDTLVKLKMDTSRIDLVVLHTNGLTEQMRDRMRAVVPVKFIEVPIIYADDRANDMWHQSLTKLTAFKEWGYERVVYMDADGVPNKNLDHLFDLPPAPLFAPIAYWLPQPFFTSVLMVIQPSNLTFDSMMAWARKKGAAAGYDMDILNSYFGATAQMLPGEYSVLSAYLRGKPNDPATLNSTVAEIRERAEFTHYSCLPDGPFCKPWSVDSRREIPGKKGDPNEDFFVQLFEGYWKLEKEKC